MQDQTAGKSPGNANVVGGADIIRCTDDSKYLSERRIIMNALYDGVSVKDQVMVTPLPNSTFYVKRHWGQIGEVVSRKNQQVIVQFGNGNQLLVRRGEIARTN